MRKSNDLIFTFENIIFLSRHDLITLLQEVDNVTLLTACSGADVLIFRRLKEALSNLAWNLFCEDLMRHPWPSENDLNVSRLRIGTIFRMLCMNQKLRDWKKQAA